METRYLLGLPFVSISIKGKEIEALLDTGFDGTLSLPLDIIHTLSLQKMGATEYILADGSISPADIFRAVVDWFGSTREIEVISSTNDMALVGMELLYDTRTVLQPRKGILSIQRDDHEPH